MGKAFRTKKMILEMLSSSSKTTTEVSRSTGLAKSTVSQHLKELKAMGAISIVDNPHIVKWKYYEIAGEKKTRPEPDVQRIVPLRTFGNSPSRAPIIRADLKEYRKSALAA